MTLAEEMHSGEKIIKTLKPSRWGYFWWYLAAVVWLLILLSQYPPLVIFFGWVSIIIILAAEISRVATTYYITSKRLIYEFTFLVRNITSTVYARIQDLHMTQGIVERIFRVGKIWVNTAGSVSVEMVWRGVKEPIAIKRLIEQHMTGRKSAEEESV